MTLSNEHLMWIGLGVWIIFIVLLGYFSIFGATTKTSLPSGNVADTGNLAGTS